MSNYSSTYPSVSPTWQCNFAANGGRIPPNATFSRPDSPINSSNAEASAVHFWSNEKHLSSENLVAQSSDLGSWSKGAVDYLSLTSNATTAPDGTTTAAQLTGLTGTNKKAIYYPVSAGSGSHTGIFFVKPNGHEYVQIMFGGVSTVYQNYHLSSIGTLGNGNNDGASITQMGDWYKITLTSSSLSSATNYYLVLVDSNTASRYQDSTSTSSVYAWGANLSSTGQKVFNATTTQIHRAYAPTLKSVATAGAARFEHDPETNVSLGCLIEGQSTNHLIPSQDLSGWSTPANLTVSTNSMVAPDGSLTADVLTVSDDTVADGHFAYRNSTAASAGQSVTVSFFAKSTGVSQIYYFDNTVGAASVSIFDLTNGSVSGANSSNSSMINCGNGWYRCIATYTQTGSTENHRFYTYNGTTTTYIANGYDGFAIWGVQVEQASAASSYIVTQPAGSTVTRAADILSVATADIGYTGGDFTVIAEAEMPGDNVGNVVEVGDGTASNRATLQARTDGTQGMTVSNAGSVQAYIGNTSARNAKRAMRVATNNFGYCESGGTVATDTAGVVPVTSTLYLGKGYSGSELNGTIKRVAVYSEALSDTNLQALTS